MHRTAVITGGGGDIGAAVGARATEAGYRVCLLDQNEAQAMPCPGGAYHRRHPTRRRQC